MQLSRFDVPVGGIVRIPFASYNSSGASVTMTGFAITDVRVYKDGGLVERDESGYTVFTDFDGITGCHILEIDTGEDDSPASFWTAGSEFNVFVASVTIDSQTVSFPAAWFRLVAAESSAGTPKVDVSHWLGTAAATPTTAGVPEVDITFVNGSAVSTSTAQLGVNVVNFGGSAGTFASGRPEVNTSHIAGSAVSTSTAQIGVNVVNFGGSAGTFASGRPETNTSHIAGSAVSTSSAQIGVNVVNLGGSVVDATSGLINANVKQISTDATAADNAESFFDGTGYAGTNNVIPLVTTTTTATTATNVTTLNGIAANVITATSIQADAITAAKVAADVTTEIQSGLATSASIAALNNLSAAQVNTEVLDVLATDTYAEPGQGNPAATTTLAAKINYLYKAWRNKKTQTSTTFSLFADDAATVDQKSTVSDNGTTATRGEIATGP